MNAAKSKPNIKEKSIGASLFAAASLSVVAICLIFYFLFSNGMPIFGKIGLSEFLFGKQWNPTGEPPAYEILPMIFGSLLVTFGAMLIAVPLGIGCAAFLSEVAPKNIAAWLKPVIELLAGIPSVVYGFFGLMLLVSFIRVNFAIPSGETMLAGSLLLAIMALPTIISVSQDAISAVPPEYREGSLALGSTRWQTITKVTIPAASSGITAAVILGIGRAIGETMAVMMVTGNTAIIPEPFYNMLSPVRTLTGTLAIEMGEVAMKSDHYYALFGMAIILFFIVLVLSISAHTIKYMGERKGRKHPAFRYVKYSVYGLIALLALLFLSSAIGWIWALAIFGAGFAYVAFGPWIGRKIKENAAFAGLAIGMAFVVFVLGIILWFIISKGAGAITWDFLTKSPRNLGRSGGIFPAIVGTLYLVAGAIAIAFPIGVGAAIYLTEYLREGALSKILRTAADTLNGIPSIVFGLFGYAFLVLFLGFGVSMLAGQITLALMILPTIVRTTEEAIKSVPQSYREGSYGLGATRWQT
ncbi:MAG: phosphate ABC transporter permease subunit PstC, partial [Candidatus Thermoplasmatota archaeon]|nr:phosphate ABC transporter permease subunit PstC [Candidatus Thermoplasmatota archaeon]